MALQPGMLKKKSALNTLNPRFTLWLASRNFSGIDLLPMLLRHNYLMSKQLG
jgi:hypothetical protein